MNVVLQLGLEKKYFSVLGRICLWLLLWGIQSNVAVLMLRGRWLSCLPCWAALLVQLNANSVLCPLFSPLAEDVFWCPTLCTSALLTVSSWLRMTCCVAPCRWDQASHPSESCRPGFRSPPQVFWMWYVAWEPFGCWAFRYLDIVVGMKAMRKAADRKILLSAASASSPGGIKLRCSLNSSNFWVRSACSFNERVILCLEMCAEVGWLHILLSKTQRS